MRDGRVAGRPFPTAVFMATALASLRRSPCLPRTRPRTASSSTTAPSLARITRTTPSSPSGAPTSAVPPVVGGRGVLIFGRFSLVHSPGRVAPIGPDREGEVTERRYPEVIAGEGHRPARKLLVVGIAAYIRDPGRSRPAGTRIA